MLNPDQKKTQDEDEAMSKVATPFQRDRVDFLLKEEVANFVNFSKFRFFESKP